MTGVPILISRIATILTIVAMNGVVARGQTGTKDPDPFADLVAAPKVQEVAATPRSSWLGRFFTENLGLRGEVMSQFDVDQDGKGASRQSVGFEVLKKFSTTTSTVASFDFQ